MSSTMLADFEFALVDYTVVVPTQKNEVVERGRSTIGPVDDMVSITPPMGAVTPTECTVAIPGNQGSSHRRRHHPGGSTDIKWLPNRRRT